MYTFGNDSENEWLSKVYLVRRTAALDNVMHFEKLFTSKLWGNVSLFIPQNLNLKRVTHSNVSHIVYSNCRLIILPVST